MPLYLCDSCANANLEPRHIVIIAGRSKGIDFVREYIVQHKYLGEEISAQELVR